MKVALYARCSTDEKKQDVEVQFDALRKYCKAYDWEYKEFWEYDSGYKGKQEELHKVLDGVKNKEFDIVMVHSLDRFSRQAPGKTERWLDFITQTCKCRFISLQENLDSDNEMLWYAMKGMWSYFAHLYSKKLSNKIKSSMALIKEGKKKTKSGKPIGRPGLSTYQKKKALELYKETGSIRAVSKRMNLAYGSAYNIIKGIK